MMLLFCNVFSINDARSEGAPYEKSPKKNKKKIVQWSHQKRVLGEGVQVFLKDFPYIVGFVR